MYGGRFVRNRLLGTRYVYPEPIVRVLIKVDSGWWIRQMDGQTAKVARDSRLLKVNGDHLAIWTELAFICGDGNAQPAQPKHLGSPSRLLLTLALTLTGSYHGP